MVIFHCFGIVYHFGYLDGTSSQDCFLASEKKIRAMRGHDIYDLHWIKHDYGKSQWLGNPQFQWFGCVFGMETDGFPIHRNPTIFQLANSLVFRHIFRHCQPQNS